MTTNELRQGISLLFDLELNNQLTSDAINSLSKKISSLGYYRQINKPQKRECTTSLFGCIIRSVGIIGILGMIGGAIYGLVSEHGFFAKLWGLIGGGFQYGLYGAAAGIAVGVISFFILMIVEKQRINASFEHVTKEYEQKLRNDKNRVIRELFQKEQLQKQLNILIERRKNGLALCYLCYQRMDIDNSFANLKSICYMNEFLRLNITDHLDGVDGLYYLVKQELRMEQMQSSIDDISRKLDYAIGVLESYESYLNDISRQCNQMVSSAERMISQSNQIIENTAITAYNTERIEKEAECMLFLETLSFTL